MAFKDVLAGARDVLTVDRVFGTPIERDGVTIIPAAKVRGGGGGGGDGTNEGGGFAMSSEPAGAYVVRDGTVRWEPAFDLNRAVLLGSTLGLTFLLLLHRLVGLRRRS